MSKDPGPASRLALLRRALEQLAAEPEHQLAMLAGTVVADELALDFANAYAVLPTLRSEGVLLGDIILHGLDRLDAILDTENRWDLEDLFTAPSWQECRRLARELLPLVASGRST